MHAGSERVARYTGVDAEDEDDEAVEAEEEDTEGEDAAEDDDREAGDAELNSASVSQYLKLKTVGGADTDGDDDDDDEICEGKAVSNAASCATAASVG